MSSIRSIAVTILFLLCTFTASRAQDASWLVDATSSAGLDSIVNYFIYVSDVNGDDYPDLVLQAGVQTENQIRLFINQPLDGGGRNLRTFVEATATSGINAPGRLADLAALADVDNDGDVDLVTATYYYAMKGDCINENPDNGGRCQVLLNDGSGHFTLNEDSGLAELGPIPGSTLSFLDYDRDGNIDLFIGTHFLNAFCDGIGARKYLMRGAGDGSFTDVTAASGLLDYTDALFGSNVADWNNDGHQDILTSVYGTETPGNLWRNNGDGTFTDVADDAGYDPHWIRGDGGQPMVPWAAEPYDFDNDGDMDELFVLVHGGTSPTEGRSMLFVNSGDTGSYRLVPDLTRIARKSPQSSHHGDNQGRFFDIDSDGLSDLVLTECVYQPNTDRLYFLRQDSTHRFTDITGQLGFINGTAPSGIQARIKNGHAAEPLDVDLDGDDDLVVGKYPNDPAFLLLRNDASYSSRAGAVSVKLIAPPGVNRSAIGARVRVFAGDLTLTRDIYAGQGNFGGQQPFILTFGIGERVVDSIEVRWPNASLATTVVRGGSSRMWTIGIDGLLPSAVEDERIREIREMDLTERSIRR
ncbi:MAG: CRTAC1 family protein [bacterium]|nr:CRTAC1 family protein [Candidatus Kapabacteria bacterium]